jgi:hypothetical protein
MAAYGEIPMAAVSECAVGAPREKNRRLAASRGRLERISRVGVAEALR